MLSQLAAGLTDTELKSQSSIFSFNFCIWRMSQNMLNAGNTKLDNYRIFQLFMRNVFVLINLIANITGCMQ